MENDIACSENDSDEEEVHLSLPEIIQLMQEGWLNELFAPEILPLILDDRPVNIIIEEISSIEEHLQRLNDIDFRKELYQIEIDRLKFLISSYKRTRLKKIETYSTHILEKNPATGQYLRKYLLNDAEFQFAETYQQSVLNHLNWIMQFCMTNSAELTKVTPNLLRIVYLKSKKDLEGIAIDRIGSATESSDLIDLKKDSQVLVSYESVANLVKNGDVHLI